MPPSLLAHVWMKQWEFNPYTFPFPYLPYGSLPKSGRGLEPRDLIEVYAYDDDHHHLFVAIELNISASEWTDGYVLVILNVGP